MRSDAFTFFGAFSLPFWLSLRFFAGAYASNQHPPSFQSISRTLFAGAERAVRFLVLGGMAAKVERVLVIERVIDQ